MKLNPQQQPPSDMPVVELVYFNAGGGHRASSLALESAIARAGLGWRVKRTHLFEVLDPNARFRHWTGMEPEDVYNKRLARGWTLGLSQELRVLQQMIRFGHRSLVQSLTAYWREQAPAMVVSLIPNFNRAMADALAAAQPASPFVTVMTDLADCPPRFWAEPQTQQILVCGSPYALAQARAAGMAPHRMWGVSGMLLGEQFHDVAPVDRNAERAALGLDPSRPVGLVLFGAEGSRAMLPIARRLTDTQLILVCGRNEELATALRAMKRNAPTVVLGYTRAMARSMQLADFFIGKPGSGSLSEAVHMGLPPIVVRNAWTMPQERYCTDWVKDHKLGLVLPSYQRMDLAVVQLLSRIDQHKSAAARMQCRAAEQVPQVLAQILEKAQRVDMNKAA
ncbi:glycosyltransferase [Diaphorobacter sp. HDW4A]|uniref:glycosyltransferase n=1 Tax=Diaphorobacter sp. HDW4A TaxID=2714924 RepID=UPI001F0DC09F|nr:glycosyltransferase [Diaphorobacter sp. HDW4A]